MSARRMLRPAVLVCTLAAAFAAPGAAHAASGCDIGAPNQQTWVFPGDGGNWESAGAWAPGPKPDADSNVCIPAGAGTVPITTAVVARSVEAHRPIWLQNGSLTISTDNPAEGSSTDSTLRLSKGTLGGTSPFEIKSGGALVWDGASTMSGAATTKIDSGATLTVDNTYTGSKYLTDSRVLRIDGTGTFSGTEGFYMANGSAVEVGGTLTWANDQPWSSACCGTQPTFRVLSGGTLEKNGGTLTSTLNL